MAHVRRDGKHAHAPRPVRPERRLLAVGHIPHPQHVYICKTIIYSCFASSQAAWPLVFVGIFRPGGTAAVAPTLRRRRCTMLGGRRRRRRPVNLRKTSTETALVSSVDSFIE